MHKFKNWGNKVPQAWANVPLLLDYRCHVPNGTLGIEGLPDQVRGQGIRGVEHGTMSWGTAWKGRERGSR